MLRSVTGRSPDADEVFTSYWEAARRADAREAVRALQDGLTIGHSPDALIRSVVARAQVEIGREWETGRCSVAEEHAVTAIGERALAVLQRPLLPRRTSPRRIVLACAPGEWHGFPARLAGDLAERAGLEVVSLGPSVPAEHLGVMLQQVRPVALALSVTLTVNLLGAWAAIRTAHLLGIPVLVGGAAWGEGHLRAERLGADLHVADPSRIGRAVDLVTSRPLRAPVTMPREVEQLADREPWIGSDLDVPQLLERAAVVATACDDPTVLQEMQDWLVGRGALDRALEAVAPGEPGEPEETPAESQEDSR